MQQAGQHARCLAGAAPRRAALAVLGVSTHATKRCTKGLPACWAASRPHPTPRLAPCAACDEGAPTARVGDNERTDRLLAAEAAVLEAGGNVVRLVGLYHATR